MVVAECRRDWSEVKRQLGKAASVDPAVGEPQAALVALSIAHAYQAFETILLRVERALGLEERSGGAWHTALLADSGLPLPGVRPAIYPAEMASDWHALLGFRHFLRHAYGVDLDPARLESNRARLQQVVTSTDGWIEALLGSLSREG